jgi:hypothetical protein
MSLLKKITHPYPFRFLLPCRSALRLPCPGRGRTLPSLLSHVPSTAARSRLVAHASRPLLSCTRWCWWCSLRPSRVPPARLAHAQCQWRGGDGVRARRWCWILVVLSRRHSPLAPTLMAGIDWHRRSPPIWCKYMFQVFQMFQRSVAVVSYGCCKSR